MTCLVIVCNKCGRMLLVKAHQRTRRCPHCENRIRTDRAKVVGSAETSREATKLIQALKAEQETVR